MAVFRIDKKKDYTVMSNHHLRNKELSLKAKGLFSVILSLPDDWDYTVKGLAYICKEGADSIRGALKELEQQGYIERSRVRNEKGQLTTAEYIIHEQPEDISEPSETKPTQDEPIQTSPMSENPVQAKPIQLNTNISNTKKLNNDVSNTYPIQSRERSITIYTEEVGMRFKKLIPANRHKVNALVRKQCCNNNNGNCILLDNGDVCACPQMISYSLNCKWFRTAVLPNDKELYAKLAISDNRKKCAICGKVFISSANKAKYCDKCKIIAIRKQKTEYQRKYRSRVEK